MERRIKLANSEPLMRECENEGNGKTLPPSMFFFEPLSIQSILTCKIFVKMFKIPLKNQFPY